MLAGTKVTTGEFYLNLHETRENTAWLYFLSSLPATLNAQHTQQGFFLNKQISLLSGTEECTPSPPIRQGMIALGAAIVSLYSIWLTL